MPLPLLVDSSRRDAEMGDDGADEGSGGGKANDGADADRASGDDGARVSAMKVSGGIRRARAAGAREWPVLYN
eukprot:5918112-Pyramimonas_sp.AAC.1